jgi:hypothetical protein
VRGDAEEVAENGHVPTYGLVRRIHGLAAGHEPSTGHAAQAFLSLRLAGVAAQKDKEKRDRERSSKKRRDKKEKKDNISLLILLPSSRLIFTIRARISSKKIKLKVRYY